MQSQNYWTASFSNSANIVRFACGNLNPLLCARIAASCAAAMADRLWRSPVCGSARRADRESRYPPRVFFGLFDGMPVPRAEFEKLTPESLNEKCRIADVQRTLERLLK
jgi:hypothetical protein